MDIMHDVELHAGAGRVFDALTTRDGLAGWYTPQTIAAPFAGAIIEFHFGVEATLRSRLVEIVPDRHIAWMGVDVPDEWRRTRITFDIDDEVRHVTLRFRQTGFEPGYPNLAAFSYCWAQYLRSIKVLLETGQGEPYGSRGSIACQRMPE